MKAKIDENIMRKRGYINKKGKKERTDVIKIGCAKKGKDKRGKAIMKRDRTK